MVDVSPVRTRRDTADFIDFPYDMYRDIPFWVPPLKISIRRQLAFAARPDGEIIAEHFLARDSRGRCSGRIAAAIHKPYVAKYSGVGFYGFFECHDNEECAAALLGAAEQWL